jgi:hypothetical protein
MSQERDFDFHAVKALETVLEKKFPGRTSWINRSRKRLPDIQVLTENQIWLVEGIPPGDTQPYYILKPSPRPKPGDSRSSYNLSAALVFIESISEYSIHSLSHSLFRFNGRSALSLASIHTKAGRNIPAIRRLFNP